MIVAKQKPLPEIYEQIKNHEKVVVLGCNSCVAVCHSGGSKEAEVLASLLRILALQDRRGIQILHGGIGRQCENHEDFSEIQGLLEEAEAILSIACGAGIQFLAQKYPRKPIYPGVDTSFLGATETPGFWTEKCQGCGECILEQTGGICPVTRCAKRLLNGPCGGSSQGSCEIHPEQECVWQRIIDRLKALGRLDLLEMPAPIKDWSRERAGGPRKRVLEDETGNGEGE